MVEITTEEVLRKTDVPLVHTHQKKRGTEDVSHPPKDLFKGDWDRKTDPFFLNEYLARSRYVGGQKRRKKKAYQMNLSFSLLGHLEKYIKNAS